MTMNLANSYGYGTNSFEIALFTSLTDYWLGNLC